MEGSFFFLSHPTPSEVPNLFLLGFSSKFISLHSLLLHKYSQGNVEQGKGKSKKARQRDTGEGSSKEEGRAGQRGRGRGRGTLQGQGQGPERAGQAKKTKKKQIANFAKCLPGTGLEPPRSAKSARWRFRGPPWWVPFGGGGASTGPEENLLQKLKRRPPTQVGGPGLEFRV